MQKRYFAMSAVLAVSAVSTVPVAAHADASTPTTIYVAANTSCTDSGTGTQATPFCTLQAGVDAAVPGDTVLVGSGRYAAVTFTHSGTAAQPILVEGTDAQISGGQIAFTFTDVSYITVSDFEVNYPTDVYAYIAGSNHVTVDRLLGATYQGASGNSLPGFEITGTSSDVTLSRNQIDDPDRTAPSIQVDAGSTGDVITTKCPVPRPSKSTSHPLLASDASTSGSRTFPVPTYKA